MRLPGRIAAAIEVLAEMESRHRPASEALRDWGLSHRFAGAGDRAAIGNLVYDALRHRASLAWRMDGETARDLALGAAIFDWGNAPDSLSASFADDAHAPEPIPAETIARLAATDLSAAPEAARADVPDWIAPHLAAALGDEWIAEGAALAGRPPLDLRVNTLKTSRDKTAAQLAPLGVEPTPLSPVGLRIAPSEGARRHPNVQAEEAFQRGRIEVQDEGSQLCAILTGAEPGEQVLDLCAGAGGKTLALAARMQSQGQVWATDADKSRLAPIFERVRRAGARNVQIRPAGAALDDLVDRMDRVLVDAPCTGTGVWRRRPDAKWRVTPEALERRVAEQDAVLAEAARHVRPGGVLAYATCSLLPQENGERIAAFLAARPDFRPVPMHDAWRAALPDVPPPEAAIGGGEAGKGTLLLTPRRTGTDGFFLALLRRDG